MAEEFFGGFLKGLLYGFLSELWMIDLRLRLSDPSSAMHTTIRRLQGYAVSIRSRFKSGLGRPTCQVHWPSEQKPDLLFRALGSQWMSCQGWQLIADTLQKKTRRHVWFSGCPKSELRLFGLSVWCLRYKIFPPLLQS